MHQEAVGYARKNNWTRKTDDRLTPDGSGAALNNFAICAGVGVDMVVWSKGGSVPKTNEIVAACNCLGG